MCAHRPDRLDIGDIGVLWFLVVIQGDKILPKRVSCFFKGGGGRR